MKLPVCSDLSQLNSREQVAAAEQKRDGQGREHREVGSHTEMGHPREHASQAIDTVGERIDRSDHLESAGHTRQRKSAPERKNVGITTKFMTS